MNQYNAVEWLKLVSTPPTSESSSSGHRLQFLLPDGARRDGSATVVLALHVLVENLVLLRREGGRERFADLTRRCVDERRRTRLVRLQRREGTLN